MTIGQVAVSFNYFKMEYCNRAGNLITTTSDTVFDKMLDYILILPNDASEWTFCLPSVYYNSFAAKVKQEMNIDKYVVPQPLLLLTKEDQLQSMSICRSFVVTTLEKIKLVEQSVASLVSKEITGLRAAANLVQPS